MDRLANALKWTKKNPEIVQAMVDAENQRDNARAAKYMRERRKNDPEFRILVNMRGRMLSAMHAFGFRKCKSTRRLIGCEISELKRHLESLWKEGMCWENYGEWHIDHIRPCASFDLLDHVQQCACFHFTNLQPMWAMENYRKSGFYLGQRFAKQQVHPPGKTHAEKYARAT